MKKLLLLAAVLFMGATQARHYNNDNCGTCKVGCAKKCAVKDDCGAICRKEVKVHTRDGFIDCPEQKTITVYKKVPVTQTREEIIETCECPAPKRGFTEWSEATCESRTCGHCPSCKNGHNHKHKHAVVTPVVNANDNDAMANEATEATETRKQVKARSNKRNGFFGRNRRANAANVATVDAAVNDSNVAAQ